MWRVLELKVVVDCWTRGYQLREEALLESVFIGNFVGGGIHDIAACMCFYGYDAVRSTRQLTIAIHGRHTSIFQWSNIKLTLS